VKLGGRDVPVWILDGSNQTDKLVMLPLSEGLVVMNDRIIVLFESAADKYRKTTKFALDHLVFFSPLIHGIS
jgi:hypothetical protein